jgi:hypothetical protein
VPKLAIALFFIQLIVDKVITYCVVKASITEKTRPLLINALPNMRPTREFLGLSISAQGIYHRL